MMDAQPVPDRNRHALVRLTALWAFSESGLGGLMFALKIPLTGFFVGGFAVLMIGLIAWYARRDYKEVLKALVLVLLVKATVSPHSPPPAYLAVAFQGLAGALAYRCIRNFRLASVVLAILAMAESALQKIIIMTLIYGKSLWLALDKLFESICKEFSLRVDVSFSLVLIGSYVFLYIIWGVCIGWFAASLPGRIDQRKAEILEWYSRQQAGLPGDRVTRKGRKKRVWVIYLLVLTFILTVFLLSGNSKQVLFIVGRSLAAVLLLFFVLRPIINALLQRWLRRQQHARGREAALIIALLPGIRSYVTPCWQLAGRQSSKLRRLQYFIYYMVALTLYDEKNERTNLPLQPGYQNG